jgi:4-aminobutyrate aminotransferase-like enzyme
MLGALGRLKDQYPFVGEVRGKGLLLAVELVKSRATREPLDKPTCEWVFKECLQRGLLTMAYAPRVRINPPLTITEEQALEGVAIVGDVFAALQQKLRS